MPNVVIVGVQWGDEGKGKIVAILAEFADIVVRFQGGPNAGHTVVVGNDKIILHQIPSGILHPEKRCVIGNGVVLDIETLLNETVFPASGAAPWLRPLMRVNPMTYGVSGLQEILIARQVARRSAPSSRRRTCLV